jgi:hypothetical protein
VDETRGIQQIFEDLKALRELRDTDDELRMIEKILTKQIEHLEKIEKRFGGEDFRKRGLKAIAYIAETLIRLKKYQTQAIEMLENTRLAKAAVISRHHYLLLPSQKPANLFWLVHGTHRYEAEASSH